jgi:hypothetical protein
MLRARLCVFAIFASLREKLALSASCDYLCYYARGGGKRSAVLVTECTMIEPTPLIRETEVV